MQDSQVVIYQPVYAEFSGPIEPGFSPLPIDNSHPDWREFRLLVDLYRNGTHRRHRYTGLFSPKFSAKTGLSASDVLAFIKHSDRDVYLFNPAQHLSVLTFNAWDHGEIVHPGLTDATQAAISAAGLPLDIASAPRMTARTLCYSNFWVGSEDFWERYVGGILNPLALYLESNPLSSPTQALLSPTFHSQAAPYLPFAAERLLSTFLSANPQHSGAYFDKPRLGLDVTDAEREGFEYLLPLVERADGLGQFPHEVRELMRIICRLCHRSALLYYGLFPHPNTGQTLSADMVLRGLNDLQATRSTPASFQRAPGSNPAAEVGSRVIGLSPTK